MANEQENMYGYSTDEVKINPFVFGLNAGNCFLTKFEFNPNGGKDGAEQECIDVVFRVNDTDKSYRLFPVVEAFLKNNKGKTTDPNAPEFKDAVTDLRARVTHILHCFRESDDIKAGMNKNIKTFKDYANLAAGILPKDFDKQPLDIFLHYQWQISTDQSKTYLEIPNKMKSGRWLSKAIPGKWIEERKSNPQESDQFALRYGNALTAEKEIRDGKEVIVKFTEYHPFIRNGYFMTHNNAIQQRDNSATDNSTSTDSSVGATAMNAGATPVVADAPAPGSW